MLNLPQKTLDKIKQNLLRQQAEVDEQLKSIDTEDPVLVELPPEASESGTDSWQQDVHARALSLKEDLKSLSDKIKKSILNINKGTYGKCERCGKEIEKARLEAMPTAILCMSCSKKGNKK